MFAEMFGVELAAIVEASTEKEDKKAEKTSLKEENKEVREEIKVDEREKPKVPVSLFEVSPGFVRPVVLSKSELDLLPKPMKELMPKEVIKEEIREVKETKPKVEEEKKAKPEEPKKEVCPPAPKTATNTGQVQDEQVQGCDSNRKKRRDIDADKESVSVNNCGFDFTNIGTWKGAEYEPKQSSVGGAQKDPRSKITDVLNERAARGNGNAPSRS